MTRLEVARMILCWLTFVALVASTFARIPRTVPPEMTTRRRRFLAALAALFAGRSVLAGASLTGDGSGVVLPPFEDACQAASPPPLSDLFARQYLPLSPWVTHGDGAWSDPRVWQK